MKEVNICLTRIGIPIMFSHFCLIVSYKLQGKLHDDEFIQIERTPSGWCILIPVNKSKGQINKLDKILFNAFNLFLKLEFSVWGTEPENIRTISHLPVDIFMVVQDIQH